MADNTDDGTADEQNAEAVMADAVQTGLLAAAKDARTAMYTARNLLRAAPARCGVAPEHAVILADWLHAAGDELISGLWRAEEYGDDPFEYVDDPRTARTAANLARSVIEHHGRTTA